MSSFITADDVAQVPEGEKLLVPEGATLTPPARELARRRGIEVVEEREATGPHAVHAHDASAAHGGRPPQRILVTAVGVNRPGVLAELTQAVGSLKGDIQDVSQRITGGYFHAILLVDIARSGQSFAAFRESLAQLSEPQDYVVTVIDERVFHAMHRL